MTDIRNITILTGAGISAESGIPVFRSETGLWEQHRVNDVATYEGFLKNKTLVHSFYNKMRSKLANVLPNDAHYALTKLQSNWNNGKVTIITQNIDDLHERASSQDVIHMHGELKSLLCEACGKSVRWNQDSSVDTQCPYCKSKKMRPNIVWFGEVPYNMDSIYRILDQTSLFLSIGTSGVVYPAAGFAEYTHARNSFNIEFNINSSAVANNFDIAIYDKASDSIPKFVDNLLLYKDLSFLNSYIK
jgi:NAD-dependent deacetylase